MDVWSVECGLKEKGIVAAVGMNRNMNRLKASFFQFEDERGLLLGIKAEVRINGEDQEAMTSFLATTQQFPVILGITLPRCIITRPHVNDTEIGISVKTVHEFLPLMKHVALELVADLIPCQTTALLNQVTTCPSLEGVKVNEGLV